MPRKSLHLCLIIIGIVVGQGRGLADEPVQQDLLRSNVEKGLQRIQTGAANYPKHRKCFSCHHQAMSIHTLTLAKEKGLNIDPDAVSNQVKFTLKSFEPKLKVMKQGRGIGGASDTVATALVALSEAEHPADETTDAMIQFLLEKQKPDGSWRPSANRPPSEASTFSTTAKALIGLQRYEFNDTDNEKKEKIEQQIEEAQKQAVEWLQKNRPKTTEDKVFRLMGLVAGKGKKRAIIANRLDLLRDQREDGGWGQLAKMESDAYATGSVLVALHRAGVSTQHAAYQKGLKYLLKNQKKDGSWFVKTRSRPIQVFFDNGDPGGKSQFISFVATNWAVQALLTALKPQPKQAQKGIDKKDK